MCILFLRLVIQLVSESLGFAEAVPNQRYIQTEQEVVLKHRVKISSTQVHSLKSKFWSIICRYRYF